MLLLHCVYDNVVSHNINVTRHRSMTYGHRYTKKLFIVLMKHITQIHCIYIYISIFSD